jgi:DNA-binding PadR family transcriptional regulator
MVKDAATLNVNETALLGLLSEKARYGYELDKIIDERLMREWTDIAFSSIYAVLKGLETKGLVASVAEIADNRVRRHYSITRTGRKALREAVRKTLSEPAKASDALMAGVANMSLLPEDEVKSALRARIAALEAQKKMVAKAAAQPMKKDKVYFQALTARAEGRINGELDFVERLLGAPLEKPATPEPEKPSAAPEPEPVVQSIEQPDKKLKPPKPKVKGSEEQKPTLF